MSFTSEFNALQKKKKKTGDSFTDEFLGLEEEEVKATLSVADIAPVREMVVEEEKSTLFQAGAFDDGYQFGDVTKAIVGTIGDVGTGLARGILAPFEGVSDLILHGAAYVSDAIDGEGKSEFTDTLRDAATMDTAGKLLGFQEDFYSKGSLLGGKVDKAEQVIGNFAGQVGMMAATGGASLLATGLSAAGSGMTEAYNSGATDAEAAIYGLSSGVIEAGTEMLFGGLGKFAKGLGFSKGLAGFDDMIAQKMTSKITNTLWKNAAQWGIKASGEGLEEVIAGILDAFAKSKTYMKEEDYIEILKDENLLDSFLTGMVLSGVSQSGIVPGTKKGSLIEANRQGRDFITGLNANETAVLDRVFEDRVAETEKDGNKMSAKAKNDLYESLIKDMDKGKISIDTIEEVLGGEEYKTYKNTVAEEDAVLKEYEELGEKENPTLKDQQRYAVLEERVKNITDNSPRNDMKAKLDAKLTEAIKGSRLSESYREQVRRREALSMNVDDYEDENAKKTVQNAIDSGMMNNSIEAREFVDSAAKLAEARGYEVVFTDPKELAALKEEYDLIDDTDRIEGFNSGKTKKVFVNMEANKSWASLIGHEFTDTIREAGHFEAVRDAAKAWAEAKGEYQAKLDSVKRRYKGIDADIEGEVTSDIVGEYLANDYDFVKSLHTNHRNVFQKIYDEIKYLYKLVTAGSEGARQLEKMKHNFKKAMRESKGAESKGDNVKYSLSDSDGKQLTKEQSEYFKDSKMRDEDGNLKVMYHGSQDAGFHVFDGKYSDDNMSFFFVDRNDVAASYSGTSETYEAQTIRTAEDMNNFLAKIGYDDYKAVERDGRFELLENNEHVAYSDTAQGLYEEFCWYEGVGEGDANYKVYLNLTNPLVVDAEGRNWNAINFKTSDKKNRFEVQGNNGRWKITDNLDGGYLEIDRAVAWRTEEYAQEALDDYLKNHPREQTIVETVLNKTRDIAKYAKEHGYDGVIFNNIVDIGKYGGDSNPATVAIAFSSEQIKSVANEKPTGDPDIRYSLSSMANTFYGDENMSANDFMRLDYTKTQGYRDYVNQSVNNMRQTRADFDEVTARRDVKEAIDGIVRVAVAAKNAGYDIFDNASKRSAKDSKDRLLFSSLEPNSDYFTSNDISTECDKRKNFADIYDAIVKKEEALGVPQGKRFFDNVDNYFYLHKVLADKGLTQPCRECYVESMRKNLAPMANAFMRLVGETDPNNKLNDQLYQQSGKNKGELKVNNAKTREWVLERLSEYGMTASELSVEMLTTEDGLAQLKIQAPMIYEAFNSFYGQSKPKMPRKATPFRFGELTALLTDEHGKIKPGLVNKINSTGGFRLQSYSDFQVENYTDTLQVLFEAGTLGLRGHAYTKVPAFLEATEGTNLKRNISIFMYKDGGEWKLDRNDSFPYTLQEIYDIVNADKSGNTGIIAVSQNEDMSAWIMANDLVGYGIPFHKSGMKMGTVRDTDVKTEDGRIVKGYSGTKDHTKQQTEVWAKSTDDHKALTKVKKGINIYGEEVGWDFENKDGLTKNELIEKNVTAYLDACEKAGYLPKFREYVMNNGKVLNSVLEYSKQLGYASPEATIEDISFEYKDADGNVKYRVPYGYYKFLGDFGMFTPDGQASPQKVLSLKDYDFDKAVEFFSDSEKLHREEILQQFANGEEREYYRNSNLTAGELTDIVRRKRGEVVDSIVAPTKFSLSEKPISAPRQIDQNAALRYKPSDVAPVREGIANNATTTESFAPTTAEEANAVARNNLQSLGDEDMPPEVEAPYYEGEYAPPSDPFANRDIKDVGNRKVKAYMYENPEVKPFFQEEADIMLGELRDSTKGEKWYNDDLYYATNGDEGWGGTQRQTSDAIAYLLDNCNYTYAQIEQGLQDIIEDNGKENNAVSKRIEFLLNERLSEGYTDFRTGMAIPANDGYLRLLEEKQITEYSREAFDKLVNDPFANAYAPSAEDYAPVVEAAPVKERYEAIRPKKQTREPRMKRVDGKKPQMEIKTANIVDTEPEVPKKKGGAWSWFVRNFVDKRHVFETLSLKTGNKELQAKSNHMLSSESRAQHMIGKGIKGKNGENGVRALNDIKKEVVSKGLENDFENYMYHMHNIDRMTLDVRFGIENKAVYGDTVTADVSRNEVKQYEAEHPEFKKWAQDVYAYNNHLRKLLVDSGVISQETADLWAEMYPHYVPIRRQGDFGASVNVPLDSRKTGVNAPVKRAVGGNSTILNMFNTMAARTEQTFRAVAKNNFGVELKNTLGTETAKQDASVDEIIDSLDKHEELLKEGKNGMNPTFTVFENGERVTFEISDDMYRALKPKSEEIAVAENTKLAKGLSGINTFRRGLITEYNPAFWATNAIKDAQDILMNSQHPAKTYAKIPKATRELWRGARGKDAKWFTEYMENGGEQNTYFEGQTNTFKADDKGLKKLIGMPLRAISVVNNFVERAPRLAEYIASREAGASIESAMLDAARVTTNFQAGGDITKFANKHGFTFLNASVQGAAQQVRNIREAKAKGLEGWVQLAAKTVIAGLPALLLNSLLWDDDEEYEELSDYVKDNYYIVAKYGDGQFVRIPKGRTVAVIQDAFEQVSNTLTGDDEADWRNFFELALSNLAPNNPLENNIVAPITQAINNKTWYGEDLVPTRLQDLPAAEQYDESTDAISKWLGEKLNVSPYKLNYLLDQYSGGVGDVFLPMMTPEAERGDNSFLGNMIAPLKDKFTTDGTMNNQNVSDFYTTMDELTTNAKSSKATDEDTLKYKYMSSVNSELGELYAQKREIQNNIIPEGAAYDDIRELYKGKKIPNDVKYSLVREIQEQINALTRESLATYEDIRYEGDGEYAVIGDRYFQWYKPENGDPYWRKLTDEQTTKYKLTSNAGNSYYVTDGNVHYRRDEDGEWTKISDNQLARQKEVTKALGITPNEYWRKTDISFMPMSDGEYEYAYDNPENYAVAKAVGGYDAYRGYSKALYDIKADKDANGKSISGSRKEKVLDYINSLDIDYGEKIILFKSEYNADDTYNYEIIDYLNNRSDISYKQMETILKELGFKVDSKGNISWD